MSLGNRTNGTNNSIPQIPKAGLIKWINTLLKFEITTIEQLGSGSIYCQIIDSIYPGKVPLNKINWNAKTEWQFAHNYKILQECFIEMKIEKEIEIDRLVKCRQHDHLQFGQWIKRYHLINNKKKAENYDAREARKNVQPDFSFVQYKKPIKIKELEKLQLDVKKIKARRQHRLTSEERREMYLQKLAKIRIVVNNSKLDKKNLPMIQIKKIVDDVELPTLENEEKLPTKLGTSPSKQLSMPPINSSRKKI